MRKYITLAALFFTALMFQSCNKERCPQFGTNDIQKQEQTTTANR